MDFKQVCVFDLVGAMAHFRKFYTNSSSLTYYFPPRTTLMGLVAGIAGYQRDSYYELLTTDNCLLTVGLMSRARKLMQTVNYVRTKKEDLIRLGKNQMYATSTYQVPLEVLLPEEDDYIRYRVYFGHIDQNVFNYIHNLIREEKSCYPPYLGLANCTASIQYCGIYDLECVKTETNVELVTVCRTEYIRNQGLTFDDGWKTYQYIKEIAPVSFGPNRLVKGAANYLYERSHGKVKAILETPHYRLKAQEGEVEIVPM